MKTTRLIILITVLACLTTACSIGKNQVAFVTSTELSVLSADTTTQDISIGYDRHEIVIAPAYPESGEIPPVYARLDSNASILNPEVRSIYATGQAAEIVTRNEQTRRPEDYGLYGQRRRMVFGTTTTTGLKLSYDGGVRVGFLLGHKRQEASVIPVRREEGASKEDPDYYASVIAAQKKTSRTDDPSKIGLRSMQFMATGIAAKNLAADPDVQKLFEDEAQASLAALNRVPPATTTGETLKEGVCLANLLQSSSGPAADAARALKAQRGYDFDALCKGDANPAVLTPINEELREAGILAGPSAENRPAAPAPNAAPASEAPTASANDALRAPVCRAAFLVGQDTPDGRVARRIEAATRYDFKQLCSSEQPDPAVLQYITQQLAAAGLN